MAWNEIVEHRDKYEGYWKSLINTEEDVLKKYRGRQFLELTMENEAQRILDWRFINKILDKIEIYQSGKIEVIFLDGIIINLGK